MSINHFTLHCISEAELQKWVAGVESGKVSPGNAAKAIAGNASPNEKQYLEQVLTRFAESADAEEDEEDEIDELRQMTAAIVAGFLHPYWYSPNLALHHLFGEKHSATLFQGIDAKGKPAKGQANSVLSDDSPSASGLIFPATFKKYRRQLFEISQSAGDDRYAGLHFGSGADYGPVFSEWLDYAEKNNLAILEACDIVIPPAGVWHTRFDNIRGAFVKNAKKPAPSKSAKQSASKKPPGAAYPNPAGSESALQLHIDQKEFEGKTRQLFWAMLDEVFRGLVESGIDMKQARALTTACVRRLCRVIDSPVYDLNDGEGRIRVQLAFRDKEGRMYTGRNNELLTKHMKYTEKGDREWEFLIENLESDLGESN